MPASRLRRSRPAAVLVAVLVTGGCAGASAPVAAVMATSSATASPTPTRSAAPRPTPTPTRSPTPMATPTPARVVTPAPRRTTPAPPGDGIRRVFPIAGCKASYGRSHHDYPATDIFAARGCAVVAPIAGRVDEVSTVDRWSSTTNNGADRGGLSWSIVGVDGVRYYGSHLQRLNVHTGQQVAAGQVLGQVGNTGSARGTATHLHFGLSWPTRAGVWWVRRGEVYPWPYLDSWKAGGNRSPAATVAAEHRRQGDVPPCRAGC